MRNQLLIFTLLLLGIYNVALSMLDSNKATYDGFFFFQNQNQRILEMLFSSTNLVDILFVCGGTCYA
jgi:hypothetical protein